MLKSSFLILFIKSERTKMPLVSSLLCVLFHFSTVESWLCPSQPRVFHHLFLCFDRIFFAFTLPLRFSPSLVCDFLPLRRPIFCSQILSFYFNVCFCFCCGFAGWDKFFVKLVTNRMLPLQIIDKEIILNLGF